MNFKKDEEIQNESVLTLENQRFYIFCLVGFINAYPRRNDSLHEPLEYYISIIFFFSYIFFFFNDFPKKSKMYYSLDSPFMFFNK